MGENRRRGATTPAVPAGSASFHLFRLEALLMALEELTGGIGASVDLRRSLHRYTGAEGLGDVSTPDGLARSLEFASRLCNAALSALGQTVNAAIALEVARLRELIVALADLVEADAYRSEYPIESENAFRELSVLLGLSPPGSRRELLHACFAVGARIATRAIGALQGARQPAAG